MRWLDRLDAWGRRIDGRYETWLERRALPVIETLYDLGPAIVVIALACVLAWAVAAR